MKGYENSTHTVLRFRRKLDTCDNKHDIVITVSIWMRFRSILLFGADTPISIIE